MLQIAEYFHPKPIPFWQVVRGAIPILVGGNAYVEESHLARIPTRQARAPPINKVPRDAHLVRGIGETVRWLRRTRARSV